MQGQQQQCCTFSPPRARHCARGAGVVRVFIAPEPARLERALTHGLQERDRDHLPMAAAALDASRNEPVRTLWAVIRRHGRALPQELYLVDLDQPNEEA